MKLFHQSEHTQNYFSVYIFFFANQMEKDTYMYTTQMLSPPPKTKPNYDENLIKKIHSNLTEFERERERERKLA